MQAYLKSVNHGLRVAQSIAGNGLRSLCSTCRPTLRTYCWVATPERSGRSSRQGLGAVKRAGLLPAADVRFARKGTVCPTRVTFRNPLSKAHAS